jgi:REP element-mobilizing transposase RayT
MTYDPRKRRGRRSIRLEGHDYASVSAYFLTLVACRRACIFGEIIDEEMRLSDLGKIVAEEWERTSQIRLEVELGVFVVMPNHFHGIVIFNDDAVGAHGDVGAHGRAPVYGIAYRPPRSLGSLVAGFKSSVTKRINLLRGSPGMPVWQRNFYEHVIRGPEEWDRIHRYIESNPSRWTADDEDPIQHA